MKASELITRLQRVIDTQGDLPIVLEEAATSEVIMVNRIDVSIFRDVKPCPGSGENVSKLKAIMIGVD